jgi:hypothetical protein
MNPEIFQTLLLATITAAISLITLAGRGLLSVGIAYLNSKIGVQKTDMLKSFATTTVRFLEQSPIFKDLTGAEKKERAILDVLTWCQVNRLPIDRAFVDKVIEEAVHLMNENKVSIEAVELTAGAE